MSKTAKRLIIWALGAIAFALAVVVAARYTYEPHLFIDPSAIGGFRPWWGSLALAALLLWSAASTACFLGAILLHRMRDGDPEGMRFLVATGALTAVAAIDDALLLHEDIVPLEVGISEEVLLALWVLVGAAWAIRFRRFLLGSEVLLVGLAGGSFAVSLAIDLTDRSYSAIPYEDYFKLVGIATFAAYCWLEAIAQVTARVAPPPASAR